INEAGGRILTLKFQLGLFDQPCVSDPNTPCVDANAANAAVTAGRDATLSAAQESMTLLRNQNNTLPHSSTAKVVVTGPSADSMTNQLGGWSVSWQGVFGAGHVCCMGPPNQIPPGTTVLKGIQSEDPNAVYAPDQASALAQAGTANAYVVAVGETAYAEGLGDQPKFFDQLPGTGSGQGHDYNPLYPFGFGLSYTTFATSGLSVTPNVSSHGTATATFTVSNTGSRSGTDIVPVYVAQPVSSVVV